MNLTESVRKWVLDHLPYDRSDSELEAYMMSLDAHGLLVAFHNWTSRLISPRPRKVHQSPTFAASFTASPNKAAIAQIINDIESGADLLKYLSRGVCIAAQVPKKGEGFNRRRDLDLLLTSWRIHHLHLSTLVESDGFVSRTEKLLFGVFRQNDAYLVDVVGHGGWYQDNLLRILMNELPDSNVVHEIQGIEGLSYEPDEADIKELRNAGVNMAHKIDGKAVIAIGGPTTAGTSERATVDADLVLENLQAFEEAWSQQPDRIRSIFSANNVTLPENPAFEFIITETGAGIFEPSARALYSI